MKTLFVLGQFSHQLSKELKKALTNMKEAAPQKDNFRLLPLDIFLQQKAQPVAAERQQSTATGEISEL